MAASDRSLPAWAEHGGETAQGLPIVNVQAEDMYRALLTELAEHYEETVPGEWLDEDGELIEEWAEALEGLDPEEPTRYWAEVVFQMMKLELQLAMRSFVFEIRIHDQEKTYAQKNLPEGRALTKLPGGVPEDEAALPGRSTTTEGREHFKRLRGMLPG